MFKEAVIEILGKVLINVFAALIMVIILINENQRLDRHLPHEKLFMMIAYPNLVLCISDAISWYVEHRTGTINIVIKHFFSSAAFLMIPIITAGWFLYSHHNIFRNDALSDKLLKISVPILCLFAAIVVSNPLTQWLFYVDIENRYNRGILFVPYTAFAYLLIPVTTIMILMNRKRIRPHHFFPLLFFLFPSAVTGLLAILFYGIAISWVGTTLGILTIFIFIQNQRIGTDFLTGLNNRLQLNDYLTNRMRGRRSRDSFGIAMIDINRFKYINDNWGHKAGDEALVVLSHMLDNVFRNHEFLCRYAGDEFIIVMNAERKEEISYAMNRLNMALDAYNATSGKPWTLSISIGYDLYEPDSGLTVESLINHIDRLMYKAKGTLLRSPTTDSLNRLRK